MLALPTTSPIGPIFATTGKKNPDALVGLDGVRAARAATKKPLVAIGGITRENVHVGASRPEPIRWR